MQGVTKAFMRRDGEWFAYNTQQNNILHEKYLVFCRGAAPAGLLP